MPFNHLLWFRFNWKIRSPISWGDNLVGSLNEDFPVSLQPSVPLRMQILVEGPFLIKLSFTICSRVFCQLQVILKKYSFQIIRIICLCNQIVQKKKLTVSNDSWNTIFNPTLGSQKIKMRNWEFYRSLGTNLKPEFLDWNKKKLVNSWLRLHSFGLSDG